MQDFTQLKVWQKAHNFTVNLYKITSTFPSEEKFGLTNRLPTAIRRSTNGGAQRAHRRATVSIESNISEGCGRNLEQLQSRILGIADNKGMINWNYGAVDGSFSPWTHVGVRK